MSVPVTNNFFKERRSFTEVKKEVFGRYFDAWGETILRRARECGEQEFVFIDLLAVTDPGVLVDDAIPLHKSIIKRPLLNQKLHNYSYTAYSAHQEALKEQLEAQPYYPDFVHPPCLLHNAEAKALMAENIVASGKSLAILDPFQNKFTQQFLQQAVTTCGTDLYMQLLPENVAKALSGKKTSQPLLDLFGDRLEKIRAYCRKEKDKARQQDFMLSQFSAVLQAHGHFTSLFKVNPPQTELPSCYLLFSSRDSQAYRIFKETLLNYSTCQADGVAEFSANSFPKPQLLLFEHDLEFTIEKLQERLLENAGLYKYKSIESVYELDAVNTNYSKENYLTAIEHLRKAGKLELMNAKTMQLIRQPVLSAIIKYKL
ncbi:hypothetical protein [Pontibacter fetidus]|uniref:Three-Cys-motif partner protein n=1 Tax=Pontibacter fetidus TaxID=2700082 RepID=A0A6B2H8G9_9BACT|nr:hypothetical protein [Pontibacter fetidus]NDK55682.1 hypothetical protein [Pontibacter fetidus]